MKFVSISSLLAFVLVGAVMAQNPNGPTASLSLNGIAGPPFPISAVPMPRGMSQTLTISGIPTAPFVMGSSPAFALPGFPLLGGTFDIQWLPSLTIILDGGTFPIYNTGPTGNFIATFTLPQTTALNSTRAYQCAVADFTSPFGATLSSALSVVVTPGLTTMALNPGSNNGQLINLTPYGLTFPFYTQTYSSFYVADDGVISFTGPNTDFTPTPAEFLSQLPRIAAFWTDLETGFGSATMSLTIDQSVTPAVIRVRWVDLLEWQGTGTSHRFCTELTAGPSGQIRIAQSYSNNAAQYDVLVGITPGNNLNTAAQKNLSAMTASTPVIGGVNENFHEWFGIPIVMPNYTGTANPFDLTGLTLDFSPLAVGTPMGRYTAISYNLYPPFNFCP